MKMIKYGVTLRRITEDDLELLRAWRNSEEVKKHMEFREYITQEMQKKWFETVNNPENFYYIIEYQNDKIGVINEKGYDRTGNRTTESGIYLADDKYYNTHIPVCASLILIEMSFYWLNGKESFIKIMKDNIRSISYNKQLGYVLCQNQELVENQLYVLTRENFETKTRKIRKAALKLSGGDPNLYVVWEKIDYEIGIAQAAEEFIKHYPLKLNVRKDENGDTIVYYNMDIDNPDKSHLLDPNIRIDPVNY